MAAFTDYTSNFLIDWVVGRTTPAAVSTRYLTASDTSLSGGTEQMTAMTGSGDKATTYAVASVTLAQLAGRVKQLQDALSAHGLIGA